jgi:hypothetical protein
LPRMSRSIRVRSRRCIARANAPAVDPSIKAWRLSGPTGPEPQSPPAIADLESPHCVACRAHPMRRMRQSRSRGLGRLR